jgi:prepilin-type N-terminal cleavage/methylation domain-containing protein
MVHDRRGFTLVELVIVSVLGALVLGAILQVLVTNQRTYTTQTAVIQGQQVSRMGVEVLFNDLRELSPSGGDILAMYPDSLRVRLMREFGIACEVDVGPTASPPRIRVLDNSGDDFLAGDTVFVFAENREATANDDNWLMARVAAVDTTVTCLGREAIDLRVDTTGGVFASDTVRVGAPVRGFDVFRYEMWNWITTMTPYLTRRVNNESVPWPIAGPLRPGRRGVQFIYRDAFGNVTTTPTDVRQIEVRIRTGERVINGVGGTVSDSIDTWIFTRN